MVELVLTSGQFCVDYIWCQLVSSNRSSTLGVATIRDFSDVLVEVQIARQSSPISITSIYNSVF